MDEIIIKVSLTAGDDGYAFSIYESEDALVDDDPIDGGNCTSTVLNAVDMAFDQAKDILRRVK